jgi:hypothetical protein
MNGRGEWNIVEYRVAIIHLPQRRIVGKTRDRWENKSPQETEDIRSEFVGWAGVKGHTEK